MLKVHKTQPTDNVEASYKFNLLYILSTEKIESKHGNKKLFHIIRYQNYAD